MPFLTFILPMLILAFIVIGIALSVHWFRQDNRENFLFNQGGQQRALSKKWRE